MKYRTTILTEPHKVPITRGEDYRSGENLKTDIEKLDTSKKQVVCYTGLSYQSCNLSVVYLMLFIQE